jgi:rRNA-processing protein FCF1
MKQLDASNVMWTKKHKIRIPYINKRGLKTYYVPDFFIDGCIIEETKGWIKEGDLLKAKIAREYCKKNGYTYRFLLGDTLTEKREYGYYGD